jgi:hypothetical protein
MQKNINKLILNIFFPLLLHDSNIDLFIFILITHIDEIKI